MCVQVSALIWQRAEYYEKNIGIRTIRRISPRVFLLASKKAYIYVG